MSEQPAQITVSKLTQLIAKFVCVEKIVLFGSRARNDASPRSDIDLAIASPQASDKEWLAIIDAIEGFKTLLAIDVIRLDSASKELKQKIQKEGITLYERH